MRAFIFGFVPFLCVTIFARWFYVCKVHQLCGEQPLIEDVIKERPTTLDLSDEDTGNIVLEKYEEFAFQKGSGKPDMSKNNEVFIDEVAKYLKKEPTKNLSITGQYLESEKNIKQGYYENLGQARANEVRELLLDKGIPEDRFAIDYDIVANENLTEPIIFEVFKNNGNEVTTGKTGKPNTNDDPPLVRESFTFTNMTYSDANFAYNSDVFRPGEPFKLYADSVRVFLSKNPSKILTIIGHTDFVGSDEYNDDLGKRRAESAKAYFNGLGVSTTINTVSMGKRQPVAKNDTDQGRQKNRRVNIKIE